MDEEYLDKKIGIYQELLSWPTSNYPFLIAIILLAVTAATLAIGDEKLAENLAIYAYYFMVIGIVIRFFELALPEDTMQRLNPAKKLISVVLDFIQYHPPIGAQIRKKISVIKLQYLKRLYIVKHLGIILFFLILTIGISYQVLPGHGGITYNDGAYFWNIDQNSLNTITTYTSNYFGLDQSNTVFLYFPKGITVLFLKLFGLNDNLISYLLSFGLIFLCSLVYFYTFKNITSNFMYGLLAGLFVVLNNLSIEHIGFGAFFYYYLGNISFAILILISFNIYKSKKIESYHIILLILLSLTAVHPFYLIIYMFFLSMFLFFIFWKTKLYKDTILKFLLIYTGIILVNSYWFLPFLYGSIIRNPIETYNTNLFNVFQGFLKVSSYINAINFYQYFNFFSKNLHQTVFHYIFYIGVVGLMVATLFKINNHKHKQILFFVFVSYIVFFNLALGPVSKITGGLWMYLWNNISWFSFFRSFSRFLIIIIPIYLFYFAILYLDWKYKFKNYILTIFIIIILLLNTVMFTGNLGGTILATQIPQEYKRVNIVLDNDKTLNSIISYPSINYEAYYWGLNKNTLFIQQDYILKDYLFNKPIAYERTSLNLNTKNEVYKKIFNNNPDPDLKRTLEEMNIRYVLVNKDEIDIFSLFPIFSENFREYFLKNSKLVESNKYYDLFDMGLSTPHIYNSYFKKINPTKYNIYIENLNSSQDLIFLESYHKNWNLYLKANPSNGWCKEIKYYEPNNANECEHNQTFFQGEELSYLWEKPIFDDKHTVANEYANKWAIDPNYIKSNYPPKYYKENSDGSIDVEMVLYFKPQSYFYLGIIISIFTFVGCIGYLLWDWRRKMNGFKIVGIK